MKIKKTKDILENLANESAREGYRGDATEYAFRKFTLELLEEISKKIGEIKLPKKIKRTPTKHQKLIGKYMKQGKSIQEAHKLAKKLEEKRGEVK